MTEEGPPFFRTWGQLYAFVACYLAVIISVLYALTRAFND